MYIRGGEPLTADVQSLSAVPQPESDESQSSCSVTVTVMTFVGFLPHMKYFHYYMC